MANLANIYLTVSSQDDATPFKKSLLDLETKGEISEFRIGSDSVNNTVFSFLSNWDAPKETIIKANKEANSDYICEVEEYGCNVFYRFGEVKGVSFENHLDSEIISKVFNSEDSEGIYHYENRSNECLTDLMNEIYNDKFGEVKF